MNFMLAKKLILLLGILLSQPEIVISQTTQQKSFLKAFSKFLDTDKVKLDTAINVLVYFEFDSKSHHISYAHVSDSSLNEIVKPILDSSAKFLKKSYSEAYMFQLVICKGRIENNYVPPLNVFPFKILNRGKKCGILTSQVFEVYKYR
jgi:hypothetical protein